MTQSVSRTESYRKCSISIDELAAVREALYDIRSKWEDIGIELLNKNETDAIKKEKLNILGDCLTEMLSVYLKRDPEPSWNSIIHALRAKAVGESQLAQELEQNYLFGASRQQSDFNLKVFDTLEERGFIDPKDKQLAPVSKWLENVWRNDLVKEHITSYDPHRPIRLAVMQEVKSKCIECAIVLYLIMSFSQCRIIWSWISNNLA